MKRLIYCLIGLYFSLGVFAQRMNMNEYRHVNLKILGLIEDYNNYATFSKRSFPAKFLQLFVNDSVMIYNDYFPEYDKQNLAVAKYVDLLEKYSIYKPYFTLRNLSFGSLDSVSATTYSIDITFEKNIYFLEKEGEKRYPNIPLKLNATVLYNLEDSTLKFHRIFCKRPLDKNFAILTHRSKLIKNWEKLLAGMPSFQDDSIVIVEDARQFDKVKVMAPDVVFSIEKDHKDPRFRYFNMRELKQSVGFYCSKALSYYDGALSSNIDGTFSNFSTQSEGFELGVDYMSKILSKSKSRGLIQSGLRVSFSKLKIDGAYTDSYKAVDADGGSYTRLIDLTMHEENKLINLVVPLIFRYEYFLNNQFALYGSLGIKNYFCLQQNYNASGTSFYRGYYPDLYGVTIDEDAVYGFGHYNQKWENVKQQASFFTVDYCFSCGISYTFKNRYSIDFGVFHQRSLTNLNTETSGYKMSVQSDVYNSMIQSMKQLKRNVSGFEMKLRYNF